jgi:formate/nitrite transporter FocA (FNT family)
LPSAGGAKFWVIIFVTFLIALGDFTHIVAGSAEAFSLVLVGEVSLPHAILGFFLPTLAGNVIGGSAIFSVITYAQVREEIN